MYVSMKEKCSIIRKQIKVELGKNSRQVSVRKSRGGAIYVTIKQEGISKVAVKKIAQHHESYQRCEATGDILQGGNVFVFVEYDYDLVKSIKESLLALFESTPKIPNRFTFRGLDVWVDKERQIFSFDSIETGYRVCGNHGIDSFCRSLAIEILERSGRQQ